MQFIYFYLYIYIFFLDHRDILENFSNELISYLICIWHWKVFNCMYLFEYWMTAFCPLISTAVFIFRRLSTQMPLQIQYWQSGFVLSGAPLKKLLPAPPPVYWQFGATSLGPHRWDPMQMFVYNDKHCCWILVFDHGQRKSKLWQTYMCLGSGR